MAYPNNILQQVQTYQSSNLALLQNMCTFVSTANTKFKNFNNLTANLGSSVAFDLPPKYTTANGLVVTFQQSEQDSLTLTCDQAANTSYAFTDQDFIFNVRDYMEKFSRSAIAQLANKVEINLALNSHSAVPVNNVVNGQTVPTGALHTESGPFRFFGDGVTAINSYQQLAQMVENFDSFGSAMGMKKIYIPNDKVPAIIGSGLNQFVPRRNDEIAMSWDLGTFDNSRYYKSNLLPIHFAGTVGNSAQTLTVVSTNDPTGANITQITFSGATPNDANAVKSGDLFQFQPVSGVVPYFLTFIGQAQTALPVQFRATADAAADGSGNVTVSLTAGRKGLVTAPTAYQNVNIAISAGMQVKALPNHRCGLVVADNAFFLAMPSLPDTTPFPSSSKADPETGVSIRNYYGTLFGQNQQGYINDCTWGSVLVPEDCMRIAFPI